MSQSDGAAGAGAPGGDAGAAAGARGATGRDGRDAARGSRHSSGRRRGRSGAATRRRRGGARFRHAERVVEAHSAQRPSHRRRMEDVDEPRCPEKPRSQKPIFSNGAAPHMHSRALLRRACAARGRGSSRQQSGVSEWPGGVGAEGEPTVTSRTRL